MRRGGLVSVALYTILVVYWAATTLARQFSVAPPGVLYDVWYSAAPELVGIALGLGVAVYLGRWWVVLAAAAPIVVLAALELGGHVAPWHDAGPPVSGWFDAELGAFFVLAYLLAYVLPLVVGVLVRRGLGPRSVS